MLNPGGNVSTVFQKSAATRMNNNVVNGARATMPLNQMAQQSLRMAHNKKNPNPPVGPTANNPLQGLEPSSPVQVPTGGPRLSEELGQDFDPSVFYENQLKQIIDDVKTEQFIQSPRVKDAMESVRFKNLMNQGKPNYQPDSRSLFRQVAAKIGMSDA